MFDRIVRWSLENRSLVILLVALLSAIGVYSIAKTPLDAIPDISDVQVILEVRWEGQDPQTIEDQITYPIVSKLLSVPRTKAVRGFSFNNFSLIYVIFEDGTDLYWARSRVLEYVSSVKLPEGANVILGPDATSLGWVFMYALVDTSSRYDLAYLRTFNDFYLKYYLQSVDGVSEVATVGGYLKEYQVDLDPYRMFAYGITFDQVIRAVRQASSSMAGRVITASERYYIVRGYGYVKDVEDLENVPLKAENGVSIKLRDIASIQLGPALKEGAVDLNGEGEVVGGIVIMRLGENAYEVIERVKKKLETINLPEGVKLVITYDRSELIGKAVWTLVKTLIKESIVVILLSIIFLMSLRSSISVILLIPISILLSFIIMAMLGITVNIMSLGGIALAIGVLIDAAVVMVENAHKHFEKQPPKNAREKVELLFRSTREVAKPLFISLLIITISFLPVFALRGEEGKLFHPLAYTKTFVMLFATLLSITLAPVLIYYTLGRKIRSEEENPINRYILKAYSFVFPYIYRFSKLIIAFFVIVSLLSFVIYRKLESEFMPPLNEGSILYMPSTLPGITLEHGFEILRKQDSIIKTHDGVKLVFGKIGRANTPTDPAPLSMIETVILVDEKADIYELMDKLNSALQFPGWVNTWGMPIRIRVDMLATGIRTPLGIKVFGDDPFKVESVSVEIENILSKLEETKFVYADRLSGAYYIDVVPRREVLAQYGFSVKQVMEIISKAIGGMPLAYTIEGREIYPIRVRLARDFRTIEDIINLPITSPTGSVVLLGDIADVRIRNAPAVIKSENGLLVNYIYIEPKTDIPTYVAKANKHLENLNLPSGYSYEWSGQFENIQRANQTLRLIVPLTLLVILILLYFNFGSFAKALLVLALLPFVLFGSFAFLLILNYKLSVAVWVGIIALLGIAVEIMVVMITYLELGFKMHKDRYQAIMWGAVRRLRPVLMTTLIAFVSLLPVMLEHGIGSQVMKRIVAPMVGGLMFVFVLNMFVLPAIYKHVRR